MSDDGDDDELRDLRDAIDGAAVEVPGYLLLPIAERTFSLTPTDLAKPGEPRCHSKGRVVGMMSNGVAAVPVQREIRCDRRPDHGGPHVLFIGDAGSSGLSYIYEWAERQETV